MLKFIKGLGHLCDHKLSVYHRSVLIVLHAFQEEFGAAYPSYETIAELGGMSKRKAQYVIKDLVEWGLVDKEARYTEEEEPVQQSNLYSVSANAQHAPREAQSCAQHAPESLKSLRPKISKKEEEDTPPYTCEYTEYAETEKKMAENNGGLPSFKDTEFLSICAQYKLPSFFVDKLYVAIKPFIGTYHVDAIRSTFDLLVQNFHRIKMPIRWFITAFFNENIKARARSIISDRRAFS